MLLAQRLHGPAVRVTRPAAVLVVCSDPAKPRSRFTQELQRQSRDITAR
jgi:hypothetical protein